MPPLKVALVSQVILLIYFQATMWLPLGGWNGSYEFHGVPPGLYLGMGIFQVVFLLAFIREIRWLMMAGLAFYLLWLGLQLYSWWVPSEVRKSSPARRHAFRPPGPAYPCRDYFYVGDPTSPCCRVSSLASGDGRPGPNTPSGNR